jgi:hypothetical protein
MTDQGNAGPRRHVILSSGESHLPPRKGYQQDALFAGNEVELSPVNKVHASERSLFAICLYGCPTLGSFVRVGNERHWIVVRTRCLLALC